MMRTSLLEYERHFFSCDAWSHKSLSMTIKSIGELVLNNLGEEHEGHGTSKGEEESKGSVQVKLEAQFISE
ncbi:hypothetical protein U9M48_013357 [Paspalum notatum var. saurae]|uniref:Uncharacterized protein n=1 Tax=Paspalum notatum var. saurae TaxID=547442 RepID=A0AAQ3SZB1_PASNO